MKTAKQWLIRIFAGGVIGMAVMYFAGGALNGWVNLAAFRPISPDLIILAGSQPLAAVIQFALYFALGAGVGGATLPFAEDGKQLLLRSALHFVYTAAVFSALVWLCFWNWGEWLVWLAELALLALVYLLIWAVRWIFWYAELRRMRRALGLEEPGRKRTKLYNLILPIWLLFLFPQVWLIIVPGNLIVDCAVLLITLAVFKHPEKKTVLKQLWWKFWLLGFAADFIGVAWMLLGLLPSWLAWDTPFGALWENTAGHITHNAFAHPAAFVWTLAGVAIAGVCIYFFDKRAMRSCPHLTVRQKRMIALTMAVVTAPWLFFIPMY